MHTATIFDEDGLDQGPIDVSNAKTDSQALDLARKQGQKWLAENGHQRATVKVVRDGYGLPVVVVGG
jgi:hypothetical protein